MPSSSASIVPTVPPAAAVIAAATLEAGNKTSFVHFEVVPFRRDADGAIVPGSAVQVTNGDIAWRLARAAAFDHDNVGAIALTGSDFAGTGRFTKGLLLTSFGEVDLQALT